MGIYQHYRTDEHAFVDQVISWKEEVEQTYRYRLTDFLNPREQQILKEIIGRQNIDLQVQSFGGGPHTERNRIIIAPFYEGITEDMFQISLKQASFHKKFVNLFHRDVLGAFLSLGIVREKLGDIYIKEDQFQILMDSEIAPYVQMNLKRVKNARISLTKKPLDQLLKVEEQWEEGIQTVASLRLDVVLKEIYQTSRRQSDQWIQREYVKVNFKTVDRGSFLLQEGDLLSVRGKGRSKFIETLGRTRKDKWRIRTARLK